MGSETEKKPSAAFDADAAAAMVKELRASYGSSRTRSYGWRISQLSCLLRLIEDNGEDIARSLCSDLSKPELESYVYEISMLKNSINLALNELKKWMLPEKAKTSLTTFPSSAEIVSEPLGVVLVISAWNYPFLLSLDPVVGCIAAGNAVVLKPSEIAPASSALLAKLMGEYMDVSAIRVVEGAAAETTALLEQKWDKICYTGNGRVGRIIMAAAAKHLTPVLLELGGKCPVVVDSNINLKVSCRRIIMGKWGCNNGQACISPDYIIATKEYAPKLIDALKKELERFFGKNTLESNDLSRIVNSNHFSRLTKLLDEDKVSDKVVYGGERDQSKLKIAPTILLDVSRDSLIMSEEIFGPLLPILTLDMSMKDELIGKVYGYFAAIGECFDLQAKVDKLEDSFDIINSGMKPLAAYLFTSDKKFRDRFVMKVSAGGLVVNDTAIHLAVPSLPFGGVGDSGMGSYHGKFSFDAFSHKKAVMYRGFAADANVRYPPYTKTKVRLLQALVSGSFLAIIRALLGRS